MNDDEMVKAIAKAAHAFARPIDFEKLQKDKIIIKIGRSYYVQNIDLLPEAVRKRIKSATSMTKHGIRVTFHKESKSLAKIAAGLSDYLD